MSGYVKQPGVGVQRLSVPSIPQPVSFDLARVTGNHELELM